MTHYSCALSKTFTSNAMSKPLDEMSCKAISTVLKAARLAEAQCGSSSGNTILTNGISIETPSFIYEGELASLIRGIEAVEGKCPSTTSIDRLAAAWTVFKFLFPCPMAVSLTLLLAVRGDDGGNIDDMTEVEDHEISSLRASEAALLQSLSYDLSFLWVR